MAEKYREPTATFFRVQRWLALRCRVGQGEHPICIKLSWEGRQEAGPSVGARVADEGWVGLHGRPWVGMGSCPSKLGARGTGRGRP
ncbi:MAG TPA: hypothetical protein VF026_23140 [Ktedonobacteraceae bacterium]